MTTGCSAYLSVYNDWDILQPALASVKPYIDELVVVDGGYSWMAPYAQRTGRSLMLSDDRVYDAIESSGIPYRVISKPWANEIEKRMAGYDACTTRHIFRIDADEILFFDTQALERYFSHGEAVGEMVMPTHVAPGWILGNTETTRIGRQSFLFDRNQIDTASHLAYLWLVLGIDRLPQSAGRRIPVFADPLAYNAHLTTWRTPSTARSRAGFYVMNYFRAKGVPWLPGMNKPIADFTEFFDRVPPSAFENILLGVSLVSGHIDPRADACLYRSPLSPEAEATFAPLFDKFLHGNVRLNRELRTIWRDFVAGQNVSMDLTTPMALQALTDDAVVRLQFSAPAHAGKAQLRHLLPHAPWFRLDELPVVLNQGTLEITIPESIPGALRRTLEFAAWIEGNPVTARFATPYAASETGTKLV